MCRVRNLCVWFGGVKGSEMVGYAVKLDDAVGGLRGAGWYVYLWVAIVGKCGTICEA